MDITKIGNLIKEMRIEKKLTQQDIADVLNVSNKTVSKWETGQGCPDVSILGRLSEILNVDMNKMLDGDLSPNTPNVGNMRNVKFYMCESCGNILFSEGDSIISCCGRIQHPLKGEKEIEGHEIKIEQMDLEYFVSMNHEMKKDHFINFVAFVSQDKVMMNRLYPEQMCETRIPITMRRGVIYANCTKHGLLKVIHRG